MYLENVHSPADIKTLTTQQLVALSVEIRTALLNKLSHTGGHIGPNLGMVEATLALHYVFNSPVDKFIFDVSHQCYTHKLITGRKETFLNGIASGYSNPQESEHDSFVVGHTSTSVSLACGLAKARDLKSEKNNIIAIIGDGSLSGGEALEGLNYAAEQGTNLIIVVNDNQMSIAENHGGMYQNLLALRETNGTCECNLFKAMGLHYLYIKEGNDIQALIEAFQSVKDTPYPTVIHINTLKGKGYSFAEKEKERFHWNFPFNLETGETTVDFGDAEDYSELTAQFLLKKMEEDSDVVAITSATPAVFGFTPERRAQGGRQFVDVGIAEEHAVALASGIAAGGAKPVYGVYSTFIQRTYDQLSQDLCMNNNSALLLVFASGIYGMSDETHIGFFDIPLISNIPNMVYLAPTCKEEYMAMMEWGLQQNSHPVAIRVPGNGVITRNQPVETDYSQLNRFKLEKAGSKVAIIGVGSFFQLAESTVALLKESSNIEATLINPRYLTGLDEQMLEELQSTHELVVVLEDGILDGGFSEKIARYYGNQKMKVMCRGLRKEFANRYQPDQLLKSYRLTTPQLVEDILTYL